MGAASLAAPTLGKYMQLIKIDSGIIVEYPNGERFVTVANDNNLTYLKKDKSKVILMDHFGVLTERSVFDEVAPISEVQLY